jgi:chromatin remodeling complex protein RSC6
MSSTTTTAKKTVAKVAKAAAPVAAQAPAQTPEVAPVAVASQTPAPKAKAVKKAAAAAQAPVAASEPVAPVAAAAEPVAAVSASSDAVESSWHDDLTGLTRHLATMRDTISTLFTEVKRLEKKVQRTVKDAGKRRKNRKAEAGADDAPKRPTAFQIPQNVSDALNKFLGNPVGTQISRAEVTKRVAAYAKEHKLMNKHAINADAALTLLLNPAGNLKEGESLSIFNLQTCLRNHYPKKVVATA